MPHMGRYRDTRIPGYRDTGTPGHRDTGTPGHRDTGSSRCAPAVDGGSKAYRCTGVRGQNQRARPSRYAWRRRGSHLALGGEQVAQAVNAKAERRVTSVSRRSSVSVPVLPTNLSRVRRGHLSEGRAEVVTVPGDAVAWHPPPRGCDGCDRSRVGPGHDSAQRVHERLCESHSVNSF